MIQGTCSNAGKSLLVAGLCRVFADAGLRPAPFKAQNMALNSYVTENGEELGRAQALQALACGLPADVRMNPVLLKPQSDTGSQVVVMGRPVGHMRVEQYISYKDTAFTSVCSAYDSLAAESGLMVLEGAGSPAEINLQAHDIVNMRMAHYAQAPVLLVGDIDRGGVFAALVGTMALLPEADQARVAGFILNRFRGDASLLAPALDYTSQRTGKPFMGVVPWLPNLGLPEEDSVSFKLRVDCVGRSKSSKLCSPTVNSAVYQNIGTNIAEQAATLCLDIVLLDLPHISNATDIDPLDIEPDVRIRVVSSPLKLGHPDAIIIPGSKSTAADLQALRHSGMADTLLEAAARADGPILVGICGGLQMLGLEIHDPQGLESPCSRNLESPCSRGLESPSSRNLENSQSYDNKIPNAISGLGLLPLITTLGQDKILCRTQALHCLSNEQVYGYEIHHGHTHIAAGHEAKVRPCLLDSQGQCVGWEAVPEATGHSRVWGTYLHGLFDEDNFRRAFVDALRSRRNLPPLGRLTSYTLEPAINRLAQCLRENLDMEMIYRLVGK